MYQIYKKKFELFRKKKKKTRIKILKIPFTKHKLPALNSTIVFFETNEMSKYTFFSKENWKLRHVTAASPYRQKVDP